MNSKNRKNQSAFAASTRSSNANESSTAPSSHVLSPNCQRCVDMLQKAILTSTDDSSNPSLPLQLLRAMGASSSAKESIQLDSNGVTICLPKEQPREVKIQKQWSEQQSVPPHHASVQHRHHSRIRATTTTTTTTTTKINATSATATTSSSTPSWEAMQHNNNTPLQQQQHDRMKIECRPCGEVGPEGGARAFVTGPEPISIVLCTNRLQSLEEIQQVLVHELIHVYDVRQLKLDLTSCHELAYSEIRAAKHAECASTAPNPHNLSSLLKLPTTMFQTSCIKSKATAATSNLFTKPGQAKDCVNRVFTKAMNDSRPFRNFNSGTATQGHCNDCRTPNKPYDSGAWHSQR